MLYIGIHFPEAESEQVLQAAHLPISLRRRLANCADRGLYVLQKLDWEYRMSGSQRIWLVGAGNLGRALVIRWVACGLARRSILVVDRHGSFPRSVVSVTKLPDGLSPDILFLAIKPQSLDASAEELRARITPRTILVSALAGVETATLENYFPDAREIVRIMPSLAVITGRGTVPVFIRSGRQDPIRQLMPLLAPLGAVKVTEKEDDFHFLTALVGSGPAFFFRFHDAMVSHFVNQGLSVEFAERLVRNELIDPTSDPSFAAKYDDWRATAVDDPSGFAAGLSGLIGAAVQACIARSREMTEAFQKRD